MKTALAFGLVALTLLVSAAQEQAQASSTIRRAERRLMPVSARGMFIRGGTRVETPGALEVPTRQVSAPPSA